MKLNVVLVEPEIPQNTGNIARTCAATGGKLHLVHPLGFNISEKAVRRAGLDYWDKLEIEEHKSFKEFLEKYKPEENNMFFVTTKGKKCYSDANYNDYLWMKSNVSHVDNNLVDYVIDTEKDVEFQVKDFFSKLLQKTIQ